MVNAARIHGNKNTSGKSIEIGCGVTPMSDNYDNIEATDIEITECATRQLDACTMKDLTENYSSIFAVNCFHHISEKLTFFGECSEILEPGGVVVILEPADTLLSRILYPYLFRIESYDPSADIESLKTEDPVKGANQAASFICFKRERTIFMNQIHFELVDSFYLRNWLSFVLCGGTNFPTLAPYKLIRWLEDKNIFSSILGLHWVHIFKKR